MYILYDCINRFLNRKCIEAVIYAMKQLHVEFKQRTLSIDDKVLGKPYSQVMVLVSYFWSEKRCIGLSKELALTELCRGD
jgi:hypothetical protein